MAGLLQRWIRPTAEPELAGVIARKLDVSPITGQVLAGRGLRSPEEATAFVRPSLSHLCDPRRMAGMREAALRLHSAITRNERILVFGDYDVDGVTSAALLSQLLEVLGASFEVYLPSRFSEGYGLSRETVHHILERRPSLCVTVDCGIRSIEEVKALRGAGVDVVVTDHHLPGEDLPPANAIVDPKRADCTYPFKELAGVGVAFKLAWAVARRFGLKSEVPPELRRFLMDSMGLVALGTVSDVVPLLGENRVFVRYGLPALGSSAHAGLRALLEVCGLNGRTPKVRDVAFRAGPRLNAAGRTGSPEMALRLLRERDVERARELARSLDRANRDRQKLGEAALKEAAPGAEEDARLGRAAIVLGGDGWHQGVIGIVAARLADRFGRPTMLVGFEGDRGKGSARSVPGVDLGAVLERCSSCLESHGGHAMAAGVRLRRGRFEEFKDHFEGAVSEQLARAEHPQGIHVDAEIGPEDISPRLLAELELLSPFGHGNPRPVLAVSDVTLDGDVRLLGRSGRHCSFWATASHRSMRAVAFNFGDQREEIEQLAREGPLEMAFELRKSDWSGPAGFELCVLDLRPAS